jgi:hypothetical protein
MGEVRNTNKFVLENLKGKDKFVDQQVDGRIVLRGMFIWLRIGSVCWLL